MIDVIDKKENARQCNYGNEYASKDWTCVISMVLTSFNVYFVCVCPCFMCICLNSVTWLFFGEDRLATLLCSLARFDLANRGVRQPVQPHTCARLLVSFCGCKLLWRGDECVLLPFFNTQPNFCSYELLCRRIEFICLQYPNLERW